MVLSTIVRYTVAATALSLVALRLLRPDIQIQFDMTFLALVIVAALAIFGRGIRIKTLDLLGIKVEFEPSQASEAKVDERAKPSPSAAARQETSVSHSYLADPYSARLIKLTPVETIIPYVVTMSMLASPHVALPEHIHSLQWIAFLLFLCMTPLYLWRMLGVTLLQTALATFAFTVWAFALGGPFASLSWYDPVYGALLLALIAFALPTAYPVLAGDA